MDARALPKNQLDPNDSSSQSTFDVNISLHCESSPEETVEGEAVAVTAGVAVYNASAGLLLL